MCRARKWLKMALITKEENFNMKEYFNIDAEKSVLGAIIINTDTFKAINTVKDILTPLDFYRPANKEIYSIMLEMFDKKTNIDLTTTIAELENKRILEKVGGISYVTDLANYVPSAANIKYYANIVKENALRRNLQAKLNKIMYYCDDKNIYDGIYKAQNELLEMKALKNDQIPNPKNDTMQAYTDIEKRCNDRQKGKISGLYTGFTDLDKLTGGLQKGNLIILAARPAVGKTAFSLGVAGAVAIKYKKPVAFFSLEMSKPELYNRLFSIDGLVDSNKIRLGNLEEDDWQKLIRSADKISNAPLFIDDTARLTITELRSKAQKLKAKEDIQLIVLDYLQLMVTDTKAENRQQEIAKITRELKLLAKELQIPIIALSQLNRETEKQDKPMLSNLKESGAIEQDADIVMFLYKTNKTEEKNIVHLYVAKHRNGALKDIKLFFHSQFCKFNDLLI